MRTSSKLAEKGVRAWQSNTRAFLCLRSLSTQRASSPPSTPEKVIFSGIQPTGIPHLGNYLGALQQWKTLQDEADSSTKTIYCVVDLHAITIKQPASQLRQWRREMLASLLAVGLDSQRSIIFQQSQVPAHSELMWILSCSASVGYLSRMTQWKSKMNLSDDASIFENKEKDSNKALQLGLFSYPVLQAADVLLYQTTHVPVGEDQAQHLEFVRNCAIGFNHLYGKGIFAEPQTMLAPAKRVMSLTQPEKKMSKSDVNPKSRIGITDTEDEIRKKIKSAVTDSIDGISYDPKTRPGVSNLLEMILHLSSGDGRPHTLTELELEVKDLSKKAFKDLVADRINNALAPVRDRYRDVLERDNGKYLEEVAADGAAKANTIANTTMSKVKAAMGLN